MNGFKRICAAVIGAVFFIAGIFKLMDPVGAGLVVENYFSFFHVGFLRPLARLLACALALFEALLGAALITGVWRKLTAALSSFMLAAFTIVTVILAIANPPMDCGCFGEALHLSNFQTLLKNLVLDALWMMAFLPLVDLGAPRRIKYVSFAIGAASCVLFLLYSAFTIPLRDYTPFKPGVELDTQPLYFTDASGEYADSLALTGKVMVISVYDPARLGASAREGLASFAGLAQSKGFVPLLLLASTPEEAPLVAGDPALLAHTFFADRRELMTFNRSNGGASYVADGQIIRKWPARALPGHEDFDAMQEKAPMDYMHQAQNRSRAFFQGFLLYVLAVLLLL